MKRLLKVFFVIVLFFTLLANPLLGLKTVKASSNQAPILFTLNAKSSFSLKKENSKLSVSDVSSKKVLLLQDAAPWGKNINEQILQSYSIPYDVCSSSALSTVNLSNYILVIVSSIQSISFYDNLNQNKTKLMTYVNHGGNLEYHGAASGATYWTLFDKVKYSLNNMYSSSYNYVTSEGVNHPAFARMGQQFLGDYASMNNMEISDPTGVSILSVDQKNKPTTLEFKYGKGTVIASTVTLEYSGYYLLYDMIKYMYNLMPSPPATPTVNAVDDNDAVVTGSADAGSKITINAGNVELGSATAGDDGQFSVVIPIQSAGTVLTINAADVAGNVSDSVYLTVKDGTPPSTPLVNMVDDYDTAVTGTAEAGSEIIVKTGNVELGSAITGDNGQFSVAIPTQSVGTILNITATDAAGNVSGSVIQTVLDGTAPLVPTVNEVNDHDKIVTGFAEAGSMITIKAGNVKIASARTGDNGQFFVATRPLSGGTVLTLTATDSAGNISPNTEVVVKEPVALSKITVTPNPINLHVGTGTQLTVKAYYSDGTTKDITKQAIYYSSNSRILSVNASGFIRAISKGSTDITVSYIINSGLTKLVSTKIIGTIN